MQMPDDVRSHFTSATTSSDDKLGSLALILAYVDDANFLVPLEDVKPLLDAFAEVATPLGCDMNTEKTRIFTTTTGTSILPALKQVDRPTHDSLQEAIRTYSREPIDRSSKVNFPCELTKPCEVTTGLRILGAPIGSDAFCKDFLLQRIDAATKDARKVLDGLSDKHTMLRIFKICTLHKVTHLFATDVACTPTDELPTTGTFGPATLPLSFLPCSTHFYKSSSVSIAFLHMPTSSPPSLRATVASAFNIHA